MHILLLCDLKILRKLIVILLHGGSGGIRVMAQQSLLPIAEQLSIHNSAAAELWLSGEKVRSITHILLV